MLTVRNVTIYNGQTRLLEGVNFRVADGEIVTLMGPSGSGKSTLFNWMIGALPADFQASGELWLNGERRDTLPTARRKMGILFQDPLLFAPYSVGQNVQLALPADVRGEARKIQVQQALAQAGLSDFAHRDPETLSGGQRGRVALLRALLAQPQALLLDEPFSRLDSTLRESFRQWVFARLATLAIPVIQVTHDPQDIPENGRVLQMADWA